MDFLIEILIAGVKNYGAEIVAAMLSGVSL